MGSGDPVPAATWPALPYEEWKDTHATLHRWTQVVGKIRLARTPWINHSWHVVLYVTPRGLTTGRVPHGSEAFQIDFDFVSHELRIETSRGPRRTLALEPRSVASFYRAVLEELEDLELPVSIHPAPNEIPDAARLDEDEEHGSYDPAAVECFHRILLQATRVLTDFRARFTGKCSPVHFFWGSFDLAVTRFSGRPAPEHPGGIPALPDWITREAYSHEVSSAGFWPGGEMAPAFFYSYAYPTPEGFAEAAVGPDAATWNQELGEFILPYEAVRTAPDPDAALLEFLESTYAAAAELADWDRAALEATERFP